MWEEEKEKGGFYSPCLLFTSVCKIQLPQAARVRFSFSFSFSFSFATDPTDRGGNSIVAILKNGSIPAAKVVCFPLTGCLRFHCTPACWSYDSGICYLLLLKENNFLFSYLSGQREWRDNKDVTLGRAAGLHARVFITEEEALLHGSGHHSCRHHPENTRLTEVIAQERLGRQTAHHPAIFLGIQTCNRRTS